MFVAGMLVILSSAGFANSVVAQDEIRLIASIEVLGLEPESADSLDLTSQLSPLIEGAVGDTLSSEYIESMLREILTALTEEGYLAARASLMSIQPEDQGYAVRIDVGRGPLTRITDIRLDGDIRTKPGFVRQLTGLTRGHPASGVDLDDIRSSILRGGFHRHVGRPGFELTSDSTAHILVPVSPRSPGSFDMVMGFLPAKDGSSSQLIGNGHIELLNAFGFGRVFGARISRLPGQASSVRLNAEDPMFLGLPVRLAGSFDGYQEDSTYSKISLGMGASLRIEKGSEIGVRYSRESTRPGQSGSNLLSGLQSVASSSVNFWGVEIRFQKVDNPAQPRRGMTFESLLQRGIRTSSRRIVVVGDTLRIASNDVQERLTMKTRVYQPIKGRLSIVAGVDLGIIRSDDLDESELFLIGGASSLRGYDENRFRGKTVARSLLEARAFIDEVSYGFVFLDLGFVDRPTSEGEANLEEWYPGFGFGFVMDTSLGPVSISYAMNSEDPLSQGRVHIGMSFGL